QKGGVGKTTTAINLGAGLASQGKRVLLVDIDPQGNTTSGVGVRKPSIKRCMYDVLVSGIPMETVITPTEVENLWIAPASIQLAGAEIELVPSMSREEKLRQHMENIRNQYDFVLIDCPPSLGLLTVNALTAADSILVPIQCEYYALEGLSQLVNTIKLVQRHLNKSLKLEGALLTMYDPRTNLAAQVVSEVRAYFGDQVYETIIPRNVKLSEAPSHGQTILDYDPRSKGAETYMQLTAEVLKNE
ncbi:MAG TPA: sporulation initiation inhibitor Soj, partial [Firmicutes bacterium]|nr:sporulation initiation inhibitor Soj [Bacillota bacterium]